MIIVGIRDKELLFNITTEGIKNNDIVFFLRIMINDIDYGFRGSINNDGKICVIIPPREKFIPFVDTSKIYTARLEAVGEGKYFSIPWSGDLQFEASPSIMAQLTNISNKTEEVKDILPVDDKEIGVELQNLETNNDSSSENIFDDMDIILTLPKKTHMENDLDTGKKITKKTLIEEVLNINQQTNKRKVNPDKLK